MYQCEHLSPPSTYVHSSVVLILSDWWLQSNTFWRAREQKKGSGRGERGREGEGKRENAGRRGWREDRKGRGRKREREEEGEGNRNGKEGGGLEGGREGGVTLKVGIRG